MPRCSISGRRGSRRAVSAVRLPADFEIPLLASFPHLLGRAERAVPVAGASGRRPPARRAVCHAVGSSGARAARDAVVAPSACARSCRAAVDIPVALSTSRGLRASNRGPALARVRPAVKSRRGARAALPRARALVRSVFRGHRQVGSLTGAVHLSKNNAGVLRPAQRGRKPRVEQKGKCWLDPGRSVRVGTAKASASRSSRPLKSFQREVSEKLPQG